MNSTGPPGVQGHMGPPGHMPGPRRPPYGVNPLENDGWRRNTPLPPVPAMPKMPQLHRTDNAFKVRPSTENLEAENAMPAQIWRLSLPAHLDGDFGAFHTPLVSDVEYECMQRMSCKLIAMVESEWCIHPMQFSSTRLHVGYCHKK